MSRLCLIVLMFITSLMSKMVKPSNLEDVLTEMKELKKTVSDLARQVMMQQFGEEEKLRADGGSGLKQIRVEMDGTKTYFSNSHSGNAMGSIHDHSNYRLTVGQGEGQYVLNGVEFRTRHNDYQLRMPSTRSSEYNLLSEIPEPGVPPEVLSKRTIEDQIKEMREWFKAWREQDYKDRDYRQYFKPLLCYLEGAWTTVTENIEEPFDSDRHKLDAITWTELQDKVRFTAYTGRKSQEENFAFLPTTIINITETGEPVYAQWNYRMLCHPLSNDLPTSYLVPVDDLSVRMSRSQGLNQYKNTRCSRFQVVGPEDGNISDWQYLDTLMNEVPGKDNYFANITETSFDSKFLNPAPGNKSLNVGYYHRRYRLNRKDAMGISLGRRGFSDPNVFMAETTQDKIAPMYMRQCTSKVRCHEATKRMSYAIPLEIIYLTPLTSWNPYDVNTTNDFFYRIPAEFFSGDEVQKSPADTTKGYVQIKDKNNETRRVVASGVRIFLPNITDVGVLRTRYPITPVHAESSSVWKELNALKDIVLSLNSNEKFLNEKLGKQQTRQRPAPVAAPTYPVQERLTLKTSMSIQMPLGRHSHNITLSAVEQQMLQRGEIFNVRTSRNYGHSHVLRIRFKNGRYQAFRCDFNDMPCYGGHTSCLFTEDEGRCPDES